MTDFWNGCKRAVYLVLFAILIPVSAYVFYGAVDTLNNATVLQGILHGKMVPAFLLGTSFLFCVLYLELFRIAEPWIEKHWRRAVPLLVIAMFAVQVLFVLTVRSSLRQDHLKIFDAAVALVEQGGTIGQTHFKNYFMKYPNNIPMCLFTCVWLKVVELAGVPRIWWMDAVKIVNILFMNVGFYCIFRLITRYRSRRRAICFLLLTMGNPLWYLLGQMYYTSTISLTFSMGAVWLYDKARRQKLLWKKWIQYLLTGALLAVGYEIRATVILTVCSIVMYTVLQIGGVKEEISYFGTVSTDSDGSTASERWKHFRRAVQQSVISVVCFVAGLLLVFAAYGKVRDHYAGFDPSETGYPTVHWIMMSAQGDGQYNSADDAYTGSFSTREERTAADVERLKERIADMGPAGMLTLFRNKMRVAFSDGTDDYYALFRTMQSTSPLQKYLNGGRADYLALYLHSYHGMLTGLLLLALIWRALKRQRSFLDIFSINLCGAYLFYLIWEVDQAYSIPFMLLILAEAADGMCLLEADVHRFIKSLPSARTALAACGVTVLVVFLGTAAVVHRSGEPVRSYSVLQDQESSNELTLQEHFSQTFTTGKAFDHIALWVANWDGAANDSVYDVTVWDESGVAVASGQVIGAEAPCMSAYTIAFDRIVPERTQTYTIEVTLRNPDCVIRTDFLYYQSAWDLYADGALYAPEEVENVDLAFAVYAEN